MKITIGKTRKALRKADKILGDINAVKRGTVGKRIRNRGLGWLIGKMTARFFR
jgi:hypothetical protein